MNTAYKPGGYRMKPYTPYQPMRNMNMRRFTPERPIEQKTLPNLRNAYFNTRTTQKRHTGYV